VIYHKILIIDDDNGIYDFVQFQLEKENVKFYLVENGSEALKSALELLPDIIFLDVMIPGMDGFEICRKIRSSPKLSDVPIVIITGLDDPDSRLRGFQAGADDFLTKPVEQVILVARIQNILRMSRYRKQIEERGHVSKSLEIKNRQLQELSTNLIEIQEQERRFLAAELHDEFGELLTGLKLMVEMAATQNGDEQHKTLEQVQQIISELSLRVRKLSMNLRPAMLDDFGLFAALEWLFERFSATTNVQVKHNIDFGDHRRFPKQIETAAFRIVQESLTNSAKYANSKSVNLDIKVSNKLKLTITDRGVGFDTQELKTMSYKTSGISCMRERVELLGGEFSIISKPGSGTVVKAIFGLQEGDPIVQD
jgi:signal transduction histidine kinase